MLKKSENEKQFFESLSKLCNKHGVATIRQTNVLFYGTYKTFYHLSIDTERGFQQGDPSVLELIYEKNVEKFSDIRPKSKCKIIRIQKKKLNKFNFYHFFIIFNIFIYEGESMKSGRKQKYHTKEEVDEQVRIRSRKYYERNKERIREKNRKRYYDNKRTTNS